MQLKINKRNKSSNLTFIIYFQQVIGYGGEWSDSDSDGETESITKAPEEVVYEDDEDLLRVTKNNTEYNMNNGNLLGDPMVNIKRTFAALKLGAPLKGTDGKKQTLKISVTPFGAAAPVSSTKSSKDDVKDIKPKVTQVEVKKAIVSGPTSIIVQSLSKARDETDKAPISISPPITPTKEVKVTMEKTLLEEISETLEKNKSMSNSILAKKETATNDVIKVEIKSETESTNLSKRSLTRNNPIKKDQNKPKIQVFPKQSESSENGSDVEFGGTSEYYDVVEARNSYGNIPDGGEKPNQNSNTPKNEQAVALTAAEQAEIKKKADKETLLTSKAHFFANQIVSEMFMSHKPINDQIKKRAESYNLSDSSYMTSKITQDGLVVTKNHVAANEDALDSTGSSFDSSSSSSDEEASFVNKSESDSGIGIRVTNTYKPTVASSTNKNSASVNNSNNSSDYEDVQISNKVTLKSLMAAKSRESAGEPDGRSDPDGSSETSAPALPSSPPPLMDPRPSFLHGVPKPYEKPKVPVKPTTAIAVKPYGLRSPTSPTQVRKNINLKE